MNALSTFCPPLLHSRVALGATISFLLMCAAATRLAAADAPAFPVDGLLPKRETGAAAFLKQNPQWDGRQVVVAIFDTGVDPGAPGLQVTSDGRPKVIDLIDGTGAGDVDTTTLTQAPQGTCQGLSGRTLKIPPHAWQADRVYHLGLKRGYDLFPGGLVARLRTERRRQFDLAQQLAESDLRRRMADWDRQYPRPSAEQRQQRADLDVQLDQLLAAGRGMDDPGPLYDCVVYHDGATWRALVDTDEDGDLGNESPLANFRLERRYGTFRHGADLNFGVNIHDDGNLLSIVVDSGPHGTHVAGIVAGHFPGQPELNGLAPGAQIVSVKIGDTRLHSMETAAGLERGMLATIAHRCDLINMSYGEPTRTPNRGWLTEFLAKSADEHGIVFVSSAGNEGPALSTAGAPGATTSQVLGIGAYVSPEMMLAQYALREGRPEMPYTFTSHGPTVDGDLGVCVCAPGGAIAPVPTWTRNPSLQMNGTSMASPNACGALALLLSAAKAQSVPYTPASVRRAIENTARPVADSTPFSAGAGMLQVDRAWEHLRQHASAAGERLRFETRIASRGQARGIYLREADETARISQHSVQVRPVFPDAAPTSDRVALTLKVHWVASHPWIRCGEHGYLTHDGQNLAVEIDPAALPAGAHFGDIRGFVVGAPERGWIVRIPVTVIKPKAASDELRGQVALQPGQIERLFVTVPATATWMEIGLRCRSNGTARRIDWHAIQLLPGQSFHDQRSSGHERLEPGRELRRAVRVEGGRTIELCLAQNWSNLGATQLEYQVAFHGLAPSHRELTLTPDEPLPISVTAAHDRSVVAPSARFDTWRTRLLPARSDLQLLTSDRDRLADGRGFYQLVLTYEFELPRGGPLTIRSPKFDEWFYDAPFGPHFWMLTDARHRVIATDDFRPSTVHLGTGRHEFRVQLRHTNPQLLSEARQTPVFFDRPAPDDAHIRFFATREDAIRGGPGLNTTTLPRGETLHFWAASSRLPAELQPGDQLLGSITYGQLSDAPAGLGDRPGGFPVRLVAPSVFRSADRPAAASLPPRAGNDEELARQRWEFELSQLRQLSPLGDGPRFEALARQLETQRPDDLRVAIARLHGLDQPTHRVTKFAEIAAAADAILARIDANDLAVRLGARPAPGDAPALAALQQANERKPILIDVLWRKARLLAERDDPAALAQAPLNDLAAHAKQADESWRQLQRWIEPNDPRATYFHYRQAVRERRWGAVLQHWNKLLADSPSPPIEEARRRAELFETLGWKHLAAYEQRWILTRYPPKRPQF